MNLIGNKKQCNASDFLKTRVSCLFSRSSTPNLQRSDVSCWKRLLAGVKVTPEAGDAMGATVMHAEEGEGGIPYEITKRVMPPFVYSLPNLSAILLTIN